MTTRTRLERLERRDAFAAEPRTFWELFEWCEQGRPFEITPPSKWWPLLVATEEAETDGNERRQRGVSLTGI